ncbi:MAG TPA: CPBP family intramembrane metalloprotease domain-containing protein [Lachnospiraceae bacterium]|nr:CPBP family intramembrane metalloprotease domain-containing protein [Lachnospiraceae bacterium]
MDGMNEYRVTAGEEDGISGMGGAGMPERNEADEIKAARKHFSRLGGMYILGTIIIFAVQLIPTTLLQLVKPEWLENGNISLMVSVLPMYIIGMPVLILLVRTIPKEEVERHSMRAGSFVIAAIMCFAVVYITNFAGNLITALIGTLKGSTVQNQVLNVTQSVSMWMIVLYMVICAPVMEEFVFRKLIVDRTVRYGQGAAVVMSGLMFGLFHGNLNQFVYAFTLGMFLAYLYVKTGNIKITIALHMLINFMGGVVSSGLMRMLDLDAYMQAMTGGDMASMMDYIQANLAGIMAYAVFVVFVAGMMIAGGVLLIVNLVKRKFVLERGSVVIPKGKRFSTMIGNAGMLLYSLFWIVMIVVQLFI